MQVQPGWVARCGGDYSRRFDGAGLPGVAAEVDAERIGVMGMSMGATRAWWLMALDERIKTGVPICCLTRYQNIIEHGYLSATESIILCREC